MKMLLGQTSKIYLFQGSDQKSCGSDTLHEAHSQGTPSLAPGCPRRARVGPMGGSPGRPPGPGGVKGCGQVPSPARPRHGRGRGAQRGRSGAGRNRSVPLFPPVPPPPGCERVSNPRAPPAPAARSGPAPPPAPHGSSARGLRRPRGGEGEEEEEEKEGGVFLRGAAAVAPPPASVRRGGARPGPSPGPRAPRMAALPAPVAGGGVPPLFFSGSGGGGGSGGGSLLCGRRAAGMDLSSRVSC